MHIQSTYPDLTDYAANDSEDHRLLKYSEERFETLVANIPGAVYRCVYKRQRQEVPLRMMVFLTTAIQDISGYPPSDFINNRVRSFASMIHPCDRMRVEQAIWQSAMTQQSYALEYRIIRTDGSIAWVYDKGQAIVGEKEKESLHADEFDWIDGVILDITERKQAEAELGCTKAFLNCVIENLPVGVLIKDALELRVMYWNKASEELFGYSKEEVLGKNDYDFLPKEQAEYLQAKDRQVLASGTLWDIPEAEIITPHRGERVVHIKKVPLFDETSTPRYLLVICEDITERKRAKVALQESECHYRRIVETASEGVWMFDAESKTTFANSRMAQMLGYTVEELLGRSLFEFMDEADWAIAEGYIARRRQGIHERHDFKFRRKDGSDLWAIVSATPILDAAGQFVGVLRMITDITERKQAEEQLQQREQFLRSIYDGVENSIFVVDVKESEGIEHSTINSQFPIPNSRFPIPDSQFPIPNSQSYEFRYRGFNPAHEYLTGIRSEQFRGKTPQDVLPPSAATAVIERYTACVRAGTSVSYEECLPLQGKETWWITKLTPLQDAQGHIYRLVGTSTNISDVYDELRLRKQAEEALRESESQLRAKNKQLKQTLRQLKETQAQLIQSEKMISLGQLVAGVAHEINNPVSFIYGNVAYARTYASELLSLVQLYNQHYPKPALEIQEKIAQMDLDFLTADFLKLLNSMKEGANRIHDIVLSLRNFSRLDEAAMKPIDIHEGIDSTLLILQHRLKQHTAHPEIQVRKEYGELPLVQCYASSLNQVFMNLLSNAIDALATQPGSREIVIRTELVRHCEQHTTNNGQLTADFVVIRIADNGPGIPDNVKKRIFDPFFTTKPVGVGTGLGLSISHSIVVEKHRGKLMCISAPGEGAEFVIELPLKQPS